MEFEYPDSILISHDEHHAKHLGRLADGRQFFLTTPFVPAIDNPGCEFIALYLFGSEGELVDSQIENLGPRDSLDEEFARKKYDEILGSLGNVVFCDINIAPFKIIKDEVEFGLLKTDPEFVEDEDEISLEVHPGNYMAFYPPWNGEYDT